jgi:hypothetical protein
MDCLNLHKLYHKIGYHRSILSLEIPKQPRFKVQYHKMDIISSVHGDKNIQKH